MNGGPSSYFKPPEPDENRYGFRKVKRGEGAVSVRGVSGNEFSDRQMKVLGIVFIVICLGVPGSVLLGTILKVSWSLGTFWGSLVVAHLFLMATEMITLREMPTRRLGMWLCWGTFLGGFLVPVFHYWPW